MVEIHPLLRQRRSSRLYDPRRPLSPEMVKSMLEARALGAIRRKPPAWRYIVFRRNACPRRVK